MQVAFLVKIIDEVKPPDGCPSISVAGLIKDGKDGSHIVDFTAIGKGSQCLQKGMEQYCYVIPWAKFLPGCKVSIPHSVLHGHFMLDMYKIRVGVQAVYQVCLFSTCRSCCAVIM